MVAVTETETWLNLSDAARAIGEHRQQLQRMLKAGKIPRRLVRDTSPPMLRLEGLAEAVAGAKRRRIDSMPAPPLEPQPPPDPVTMAEIEQQRTQARLQAALQREQAWIRDYAGFRKWASEQSWLELHKELGDHPTIGDVMVWVRETLLQKLKALDSCELESRFPR